MNSRPSLDVGVRVQSVGSEGSDGFDLELTMRGAMRFEREGRRFDCSIDVTVASQARFSPSAAVTTRFTGTGCGERVDETITVTF
jgi:hypothetical protein